MNVYPQKKKKYDIFTGLNIKFVKEKRFSYSVDSLEIIKM